MELSEATLDLARYAQGVEEHIITSAANSSEFICNDLSARMGEYTNGGTCWFLSGESKNKFTTILNASGQTVDIAKALTFAAGDSVALSWFHYFNTSNLVNAVNHVLYDYPIMDMYVGTTESPWTYTHRAIEFELPDAVGMDVRRVEVETWHPPFPPDSVIQKRYTTSHYWTQEGRTLLIMPNMMYHEGGDIRVHYVREHGATTATNPEVSEQVDRTYLRTMANLWLWTHEIQMKHKDNPIAVDMYNNARMDEDRLLKRNIPASRLMPKDICYMW